MFDIKKELNKYGLTEESYEDLLKDCFDKVHKTSDLDWSEITYKYNINMNPDTCRKAQQPPILGGAFVKQYYEEKNPVSVSGLDLLKKIETEKNTLRKERIKMQTINAERNRLDRAESRQELYYENVGAMCATLPLPEFYDAFEYSEPEKQDIEYLVTIADIHYGAKFTSQNNVYSPEIAVERFEYLYERLYQFVKEKKINTINIACLGDTIQGCLRLSDLQINDSSVVKATVEVSRLIAGFLNKLSSIVNVYYYHVPFANHSQIRPLNSKASELGDEDLEYVISNYIKDLCRNNPRIKVVLAHGNENYIKDDIKGYNILMTHGHQIKNLDTALKDYSALLDNSLDYVIVGHYHGGKSIPSSEGCVHDTEVIVCPSFIGSDPYSDSIFKGSKAAVKILGFDELGGNTETYKIILN